MNNQFGPDAWDSYLSRIESSLPQIEALGVTDYYSLDEYEVVLGYVANGRLADVGLIFPNVELRLATATGGETPVNMHLLVSPEDPNHIEEARRFLRTLKFAYRNEVYACERADLVRLGRVHDPTIVDDTAALRSGTNLFKLTIDGLKGALRDSTWAQENIIVAVAGGTTDGTSGVRDAGGSLEAVRVEIERLARIIFASSLAQRRFWIGEGPASLNELREKWDGPKACLHGSDAHTLEAVGRPDDNRYTWLRGDATFESLRQACLEPKERAIVAERPPDGALAYRVINQVTVRDADWVATPEIELNHGLVCVIGARGSGKTALADLIAAGADAASDDQADQTFLQRAGAHLHGSSVLLSWGDGNESESSLPPEPGDGQVPRVQYLSQQFVERLCSAEGITDELLTEIERVIYEAHPFEDRLGTSSFRELLDVRASRGRAMRARAKEEMAELATRIDTEREARDGLPALLAERRRLIDAIAKDKLARSDLIVTGGEQRARRLEVVNAALAVIQSRVDVLKRRETSLTALSDVVRDFEVRRLPAVRSELERTHAGAGLSAQEWASFEATFRGGPRQIIEDHLRAVTESITRLNGPAIERPTEPPDSIPPFVADSADLEATPLLTLKAEAWRLGALIGLDASKVKQLDALNAKIAGAEATLVRLDISIASANGAARQITELSVKRRESYAALFDGFTEEQLQLQQIYAPLGELLGAEAGTLGKLTFTVRRIVDVEAWARRGESLFDLRTGSFRGRGELLKVATEALLPAWESGAGVDVATAMATFRDTHDQHILEQARVPRTEVLAFRKWAAEISSWLNSTDHITVQYGVQYDGVDIEQLSPGTRGIVLLLLYLSVDQSDDRPLIIDQPEENLDPKSVFDELVGRFVDGRKRRQIIIVTHNANLVVNTDADQVIIADAGAHRAGQLPVITYTSGGLENPAVREHVCEILEGGRQAFEERARRLRFKLAR